MKSNIREILSQGDEVIGKAWTAKGIILICDRSAPGSEDDMYLAPSLRMSDNPTKCVYINHAKLFRILLKKKVPVTIGGYYGGICYPCELRGEIAESKHPDFQFAVTRVKSLRIWVPAADGGEQEMLIEFEQ